MAWPECPAVARKGDTPVVRRTILVTAALIVSACSSNTETPDQATPSPTESVATTSAQPDRSTESAAVERVATDTIVGRTNVDASGNRYLPGILDLSSTPTTIQLPFEAIWVLPLADSSLIVVDETGSALSVQLDGSTATAGSVDPTVAPLAILQGDDVTLVPSTAGVDSDVPDASLVEAGGTMAWYDGATDRVPHGALGDTTESTRLVIQRRQVGDPMDDTGEQIIANERVVIDLEDDPSSPVFEGLSPLLADVDGDGSIDVLTTISDAATGARLAVFDTNGELLAESDPIGRGNRWRHQIAVAPTDPNGDSNEVIEVQTPHIGGLLQFHRLGEGDLGLQFQIGDFQSHELGSRNLDGAVVFDADDDGAPEVVVPTQSRDALAIVDSTPADDGPLMIDLGGATVSSNLALGETEDGLRFAVALSDGRLLVW